MYEGCQESTQSCNPSRYTDNGWFFPRQPLYVCDGGSDGGWRVALRFLTGTIF